MLFNSLSYVIFLPIVFILYWIIGGKNIKFQNAFLLLASYIFYCFWDYRFGFLLAFSTFLCYYGGLRIDKSETRKKVWLIVTVCANLSFLFIFKYYNFFVDSFADLLTTVGFQPNISTLKIILPVGISFYTFHGLSYVIDIYKKQVTPTKNVVDYSLFVAFFPLLVAGPIERATHLLPQIQTQRKFDYTKAVGGMRQMLWGFFRKMVIADNCSGFVNDIFDNYTTYPASALVIGSILFAFQIYCDFAGYSDIALGTAKLLGFDLLRNFNFPYFARDIAEFWRRWHISLTTWFRDYIYIPLGGSRVSKPKVIRNTFVIFLVSGFWHGANWTFVLWGAFHALLFIPFVLLGKNRKYTDSVAQNSKLPSMKEFLQMVSTFTLVALGWIIFRADTITQAVHYIGGLFSKSLFEAPHLALGKYILLRTLICILVLIIVEWIGRKNQFALQIVPNNRFVRWGIYFILLTTILLISGQQATFIYFQF